jgi:hypothetical protein
MVAYVWVAAVLALASHGDGNAFGRKQGHAGTLEDVASASADFEFQVDVSSSHQCHGQTFDKREWRSRSCYYRNLCYDTAESKFIYYRSPSESLEFMKYSETVADNPKDYFEGPGFPSGAGRGLLPTDLDVSLGPVNAMWEGGGYKWAPEIVDGPIPHTAVFDKTAPLFVLYMSYNGHNIGHLMFDEHLPWFALMQSFGLETTHMQPLSLQFPDGPTLDGLGHQVCNHFRNIVINPANAVSDACFEWYEGYKEFTNSADFWAMTPEVQEEKKIERKETIIDDCNLNHAETLYFEKVTSDVCDDYYKRFNPLMTSKKLRNFPDYETSAPALVCFPKLLTGIGYLSEHCDDSSFHGDKKGGNLFCNHARGPQFLAFRNFMLGNLLLPTEDLICKGDAAQLEVVFALRSPKWHGFVDEKVPDHRSPA